MNLNFLFFLLSRSLFASWVHKQKLTHSFAVGTVVPMSGVAVGVFAFVVVLGIMSGFVENIKKELIKLTPHVQIVSTNPGQNLQQNFAFLQEIQNVNQEQIQFLAPFQLGSSIIQSDNQATLITLEGIDPDTSPAVLDVTNFLVAGFGLSDLDAKTNFPSVIIGRDLALQLNLNIDSVVTLISVQFDEGFAPTQMPVLVRGIYDTGRTYLDSKIVYISLNNANRFFASPKTWKGVQLKLSDPFDSDTVVQQLNQFFKKNEYNLVAQSWTSKNSALLKALFLEHLGMILVMTMIILVGCFSITITLLLSLHRKTRELAILRGLGLTQKDLGYLYLGQGFVIGLSGVLIGLSLGLLTLYIAHNYQIPFITGLYSRTSLPIKINAFDIVIVSVGSVLLATISAFWPAYKARHLNVIDVLAIRQ